MSESETVDLEQRLTTAKYRAMYTVGKISNYIENSSPISVQPTRLDLGDMMMSLQESISREAASDFKKDIFRTLQAYKLVSDGEDIDKIPQYCKGKTYIDAELNPKLKDLCVDYAKAVLSRKRLEHKKATQEAAPAAQTLHNAVNEIQNSNVTNPPKRSTIQAR